YTGSATVLASGGWYNVVGVRDSGVLRLYVNGASDGTLTESGATNIDNALPFHMGIMDQLTGSKDYRGQMDEVALWNRALTPTEINDVLWNGGIGNTYTDVFGFPPSVTLTSPANDSELTSGTIDFISIVTDDEQVTNVSFYLDGILNETDTSGFNGTYTFTKTVSEGVHNWSILAFDNQSLSNQSETRTFNYTQPPINIVLNNPSDAFISQIPTVRFNCSAADPIGVEQLNLTINGVVEEQVVNSSVSENLSLEKN
ncbi:unnamed protein product, partial [marine sediment metagenome]